MHIGWAAALGLSLMTIASTNEVANAAGAFDGHWVGEAPAIERCAISRFYFDIRDNTVSGLVTGELDGLPALTSFVQGIVSGDGISTITYGGTRATFQGSFRFLEDQVIGNLAGPCGSTQRTMRGVRVGRNYPTSAFQAPFDGDYVGEERLTDDRSGRGACGDPGPFQKVVRVTMGRWGYTYNYDRREKVEGTVDTNGSLSGFGRSYEGGVRFSGTIRGNDLTGEVSNGNCTYSLRMQKKL
jgi:hypothetical protein